jgi:four helix bundle protein
MSVSANYRAARRARSRKEFLAKIGIVAEEADESQHWLELVQEGGLLPPPKLKEIVKEAGEMVAILSTIQRSTRISGTKKKVS